MKSFIICFLTLVSFFHINPAQASERTLKIVTDKGTVYEMPCPNEEGIQELYYTEDGKRYSQFKRCYATVRLEVGAWLPIWAQGLMPTGGVSGGMQLRLEPDVSLRLAGGFGGWINHELNGITWYASATARYHMPGDVLRLGVGLGITQQHLEGDSLIENFLVGGVIEAELELGHHFIVVNQLTLGTGGLYNQPTEFGWQDNFVLGYRF